MLIRVRKPTVGVKRLTRQNMPCCCASTALLAASNRARSSGSRPKPLVTAIPWTLSESVWTMRSTRVRLCA